MSHVFFTRCGAARPNRVKCLVFVSAYFAVTINIGFFYSISRLFVDIRQTFGTTRAQTATIHSTAVGCGMGLGILNGLIVSRLGARPAAMLASVVSVLGMVVSFFSPSIIFLVIGTGIMTASGMGCVFLASSAVVGQHFRGNSAAIAMSILATGAGVGGMIYPYFVGYLLDEYGLRGTFLLLAGLLLHTIPAAALWMPPDEPASGSFSLDDVKGIDNLSIFTINTPEHKAPLSVVGETTVQIQYANNNQRENASLNKVVLEEVKANPNRRYSAVVMEAESTRPKRGCASVMDLLQNKIFVFFSVAIATINPALTVFIVFIVDYFVDRGFSQDDASLGLLLMNISSFLGRLLPGLLMQHSGVPIFTSAMLSGVLGCITLSLLTFVNTLPVLLVLCCVIGIAIGLTLTAYTVTTQALVGPTELANAIGVIFSINGIANLVAGPVSGLIRDVSESYNVAFLGAVGPILVGCLLLAVTQRWFNARQRARKYSASLSYISKL